jgi:hypothetical protein
MRQAPGMLTLYTARRGTASSRVPTSSAGAFLAFSLPEAEVREAISKVNFLYFLPSNMAECTTALNAPKVPGLSTGILIANEVTASYLKDYHSKHNVDVKFADYLYELRIARRCSQTKDEAEAYLQAFDALLKKCWKIVKSPNSSAVKLNDIKVECDEFHEKHKDDMLNRNDNDAQMAMNSFNTLYQIVETGFPQAAVLCGLPWAEVLSPDQKVQWQIKQRMTASDHSITASLLTDAKLAASFIKEPDQDAAVFVGNVMKQCLSLIAHKQSPQQLLR